MVDIEAKGDPTGTDRYDEAAAIIVRNRKGAGAPIYNPTALRASSQAASELIARFVSLADPEHPEATITFSSPNGDVMVVNNDRKIPSLVWQHEQRPDSTIRIAYPLGDLEEPSIARSKSRQPVQGANVLHEDPNDTQRPLGEARVFMRRDAIEPLHEISGLLERVTWTQDGIEYHGEVTVSVGEYL